MKKITVIDQTLREGMQYRGIFFSLSQREKILEFQNDLGIDICQAGYPPAHVCEIEYIKKLHQKTLDSGYSIRVAGLGRVFEPDIRSFLQTRIKDIHLHMRIGENALSSENTLKKEFQTLGEFSGKIRENIPDAVFGLSILDIGKYDIEILKKCAVYLAENMGIHILTLPDTSGILPPNLIFEKIKMVSDALSPYKTQISTHCHNDLGMASANTVMGVVAGATVIETSALGIGERNGIGDLYTTCRLLKDQGCNLSVDVTAIDVFRDYYEYVNGIVKEQSGFSVLNYNTPFFGNALKTHVAGTHGKDEFGIQKDQAFFINVLCGKSLVKKYLDTNGLKYDPDDLGNLTEKLKNFSVKVERSLKIEEIRELLGH